MTDKKLTDNEIIKTLQEMADYPHNYEEGQDLQNALDLVNRLQSQNKDLAEMVHNLIIEKDALFDKAEELKAEVEKLNKEIQITKDAYTMLQTKIEIIKSETVKEFMEKLKENISDDCRIVSDEGDYVGYDCDDVMYCINNLVKEFEEKENTAYDD